MSYTHLTKTELVFIEEYHAFGLSGRKIAKKLKRGHETIYRIVRQLNEGFTAIDIYFQYQANKARCGRKKIQLTLSERNHINEKVREGWTPDVIIGRKEKMRRKKIKMKLSERNHINDKVREGSTTDVIIGRKEKSISCSMRTLYRKFASNEFDQEQLPMQGRRKPNGHQEKRGKQNFKRSIRDRDHDYPDYQDEFGHLEGDTIVGRHHKSAVITLVERLTKCIIAIKPNGRQAADVETSLNKWFGPLPRHIFKSIIFDNGKEF